MHTGNLTRLVVVIDVKDNQKAFTSALKSEETKKRRMALLKQYGNDKALNDNDFSGEEDNDDNCAQVPADQEMVYAAIADNIFLDVDRTSVSNHRALGKGGKRATPTGWPHSKFFLSTSNYFHANISFLLVDQPS